MSSGAEGGERAGAGRHAGASAASRRIRDELALKLRVAAEGKVPKLTASSSVDNFVELDDDVEHVSARRRQQDDWFKGRFGRHMHNAAEAKAARDSAEQSTVTSLALETDGNGEQQLRRRTFLVGGSKRRVSPDKAVSYASRRAHKHQLAESIRARAKVEREQRRLIFLQENPDLADGSESDHSAGEGAQSPAPPASDHSAGDCNQDENDCAHGQSEQTSAKENDMDAANAPSASRMADGDENDHSEQPPSVHRRQESTDSRMQLGSSQSSLCDSNAAQQARAESNVADVHEAKADEPLSQMAVDDDDPDATQPLRDEPVGGSLATQRIACDMRHLALPDTASQLRRGATADGDDPVLRQIALAPHSHSALADSSQAPRGHNEADAPFSQLVALCTAPFDGPPSAEEHAVQSDTAMDCDGRRAAKRQRVIADDDDDQGADGDVVQPTAPCFAAKRILLDDDDAEEHADDDDNVEIDSGEEADDEQEEEGDDEDDDEEVEAGQTDTDGGPAEAVTNEELEEYRQFERGIGADVPKEKKHKSGRRWLDEEAELSGSDRGSDDDVDDNAPDEYEAELGDLDELPTEEELEKQVRKIYNKQALDSDAGELRRLQEALLEHGELHTDERRMQWRFNKYVSQDTELDGCQVSMSTGAADPSVDDCEPDENWVKAKVEATKLMLQSMQQESAGGAASSSASRAQDESDGHGDDPFARLVNKAQRGDTASRPLHTVNGEHSKLGSMLNRKVASLQLLGAGVSAAPQSHNSVDSPPAVSAAGARALYNVTDGRAAGAKAKTSLQKKLTKPPVKPEKSRSVFNHMA